MLGGRVSLAFFLFPPLPVFREGPAQLGVGEGGERFPPLAFLLLDAELAEEGQFQACDIRPFFLCLLRFSCLPISISRGG